MSEGRSLDSGELSAHGVEGTRELAIEAEPT